MRITFTNGDLFMHHRTLAAFALAPVLVFAACDSDETTGETGHTPDEAVVTVDGLEVDTLRLVQDAATRVVIQFYHDGELLEDIEASHFTALTFDPPTLATDAAVPDANFSRDVTGDAVAGTIGEMMVGYGHDEAANAESFGPFPVKVE
jgi:hypothetical protein